MANLSPAAYAKKHARIGDRIARRAAQMRQRAATLKGFTPSTGPSLAAQIAAALKRPGVVATHRPTSSEGATSFHYAITQVTKGSPATALATGSAKAGMASAHQRYVERDGAAEKASIERDIAVANFAAEQQQYIEREAAAERGQVASFGNIADTLEERLEFWREVEKSEYAPKTHTIILDPTQDVDFWKAVDTPTLNAPIALVNANRAGITRTKVSDEIATAILAFAKTHRSPTPTKTPAVDIELGRGGRIQTRIIAELPHEIPADKRLQIARDFCDTQIANIEPQEPNKKKRVLRYWAVIHAPNSHNDNRNNHLHIVFYGRPADLTIDKSTGKAQWDFAIVESFTNYRKTRSHRPYEQERSRIVQEIKWTRDSRAYLAKIVNAALKDAGVARRYDARRYSDIGIDETPIPRIDPKAYQKEKQGRPTHAGDKTIAAQWAREKKRLAALYDTVAFDDRVTARFNAAVDRLQKRLHTSAAEVEKQFAQWASAIVAKRGALADRAAALFNYAQVRSRLTPPLDSRPKPDIAAVKAAIDTLQKDELAPLNHNYRGALLKEKTALAALAKLEQTYSGPPLPAPTVTAVPTTPKPAPKPLTPPLSVQAPSQPAPTKTPLAPPSFTPITPVGAAPPQTTVTLPVIVAPPPQPAERPKTPPVYGTHPALANRRTYGGTPISPSPFFAPYASFLPGQQKQAGQQRGATWAAGLSQALAAGLAAAAGNVKQFDAGLEASFASHNAREKANNRELAEEDAKLEQWLRETLPIDTTLRNNVREAFAVAGLHGNQQEALAEKLGFLYPRFTSEAAMYAAERLIAVVARDPALIQGPEQSPAPQTPAPLAQPAAAPAPPPPQSVAAPAAQPAPPAALDAAPPTIPPAPAPTAPEPSPSPAVTPRRVVGPAPSLYRRRVRELSPEERAALTQPQIRTQPKTEPDIPATTPAHGRRWPTTQAQPAVEDAAPVPEAQRAKPQSPAAPAERVPEPGRAPAPAPAAQAPETPPPVSEAKTPPAQGAIVDIAALPTVKKRKKRKLAEMSPEERRRVLIARRQSQGRQR